MCQNSSVSQITLTCQHKFLEIKTQWINLNLWTINRWKLTKISLKRKMDSKHRQARRNQQSCLLQWDPWEDAQGQAPEHAQGELHQGDLLATIWPMLDMNFERPSSKRPAECRTSTQMNKHSSKRPLMATSTLNALSFKNKDKPQDPTWRDSECFSRNPKRNRNSYRRFSSNWFWWLALPMLTNYLPANRTQQLVFK